MTQFPTRMGRLVHFTATEEQAAHRIAERLSRLLETYVDPYGLKIHPARGFWTHDHQDVRRFTGAFPRPHLPKLSYTFGSWDMTVSKIASGCRFDLEDVQDDDRGDVNFEISKPAA